MRGCELAGFGALGSIFALVCGCGGPRSYKSVADMPLESDIAQVKKFYSASPWLSFDEAGDPNPEGFKATVYLISARTGKGAFGDGDIEVTIYSHPRSSGEGAGAEPILEKQWILSPESAMPCRAKSEQVMGFGYGLRLNWGDTDLLGKTVSVHIDYRRTDGRLIRSQPKWLRVPPRFEGY